MKTRTIAILLAGAAAILAFRWLGDREPDRWCYDLTSRSGRVSTQCYDTLNDCARRLDATHRMERLGPDDGAVTVSEACAPE